MKKIFVIMFFLVNSGILFSQYQHINCIIFIDGKLPDLHILRGYFSYNDSIQINFDYVIGEIRLNKDNYEILNTLDPTTNIEINLSYLDKNDLRLNYAGNLKIEWLSYRYIIIRITNLNEKKGIYYFGVSTPESSSKFIKQEYDMFPDW